MVPHGARRRSLCSLPPPCTVNVSSAHSVPGARERIGDTEAIVGKSDVFCLRGNFPTVMLTVQDRGQVLSWLLLLESTQLVNPTDFSEESDYQVGYYSKLLLNAMKNKNQICLTALGDKYLSWVSLDQYHGFYGIRGIFFFPKSSEKIPSPSLSNL